MSLMMLGCVIVGAAWAQDEGGAVTPPATTKPATTATGDKTQHPERPTPPPRQESPLATARRAVNEAATELSKANAAYNGAKAKAAQGIQQTPQWQQLIEAQKQAQSTFAAATQPVLEKVHADPRYQNALAAKQRADAKMAELRTSATPTADELTEAGREQATNSALMKKLEEDALAADPAALQAKTNVEATRQALADLKKQAEETTANDPDVQAAKQAVDEAEKKLEEARKTLQDQIKSNQPQRPRPTPPPPPPPRGKRG
jgi:hypothetical protein